MDPIEHPEFAYFYLLTGRLREQLRDERGVNTLEMVIIALGLLLAAGAAIAVITVAIKSRTGKIK